MKMHKKQIITTLFLAAISMSSPVLAGADSSKSAEQISLNDCVKEVVTTYMTDKEFQFTSDELSVTVPIFTEEQVVKPLFDYIRVRRQIHETFANMFPGNFLNDEEVSAYFPRLNFPLADKWSALFNQIIQKRPASYDPFYPELSTERTQDVLDLSFKRILKYSFDLKYSKELPLKFSEADAILEEYKKVFYANVDNAKTHFKGLREEQRIKQEKTIQNIGRFALGIALIREFNSLYEGCPPLNEEELDYIMDRFAPHYMFVSADLQNILTTVMSKRDGSTPHEQQQCIEAQYTGRLLDLSQGSGSDFYLVKIISAKIPPLKIGDYVYLHSDKYTDKILNANDHVYFDTISRKKVKEIQLPNGGTEKVYVIMSIK